MLGDVLLLEDKHESAAREIFALIQDRLRERFVIAISGESGSGKSELTHMLAKVFKENGRRAKPLHIDNYYRIHPLERTQWRMQHGIEHVGLEEYDWPTINRNLDEFRKGLRAEMPCVDIVTEQVDRLITDFGEVDTLIVDGLYAIQAADVDVRVFIDITYHETKKAQLRRGKEPQNEYRASVLQREHEVVTALKPKAEIIVDRDYRVKG